MPVAQRLGWGRTQCDPLLLGEALPKIRTVGLSIPPAQNTYGVAPSLPSPTTPLTLRSPKPNYGQLTPKGHTWGGAFCTPPFWDHGQVTPNPKKLGGAILGNPILGPSGHLPFFAVLDSWASADHLDHPHTYRYRPQTHLSWGKPKLNLFFNFPIPHTGCIIHSGDLTYGSRFIHIIYTRGTDTPHRGGARPPSSPLHHEAKEQVQFCSTPR